MFKCLCGGQYARIPDSDVDDLPPVFTARKYHCDQCTGNDWLTPEDLGIEAWPDSED